MRRLLLTLPLLAPLPALANDAFCQALERVVTAAQFSFDSLPRAAHLLPGSIEERRGIVRTPEGPSRNAVFALMLRVDGRQHAPQVTQRFAALQSQIAACLPDAQASRVERGQGSAEQTHWTTQYAVIGLRADDATTGATAEVELMVAARW